MKVYEERSLQIAKSSVLFYLQKQIKRQMVQESLPKPIHLVPINPKIIDDRLVYFSNHYKNIHVTMLVLNKDVNRWTVQFADTGFAIAAEILRIANLQFHPEQTIKDQEIILLNVAEEVWRGIDSWSNPIG